MYLLRLGSLFLFTCFFFTAQASAESIQIGLIAPLTGAFASEGKDMRDTIQLLAKEINASGGVNGKKIELVIEDDGSTPRTGANAANRLTSMGVDLIVGTYGSATTEAIQDILHEAGAVQIATGATSLRLTDKGLQSFFRTSPRDDEQGRVAIQVLKKLGFKNIAIVHDNSAYAKGLADESKKALEAEGLSLSYFDALQPGERDYTAILTKLKGLQPDAILFTAYYPEAGMLLRQMHEANMAIPLLGGDGTNNIDIVKIAGKDAATGYYFISPPLPFDINTEKTKNFLAAYTKEFGHEPSSIWSLVAADAFGILVEAVKHVGTDPEKVADYIHSSIKDYDGFTGSIAFDKKGDRVGDLYRLYTITSEGTFQAADY